MPLKQNENEIKEVWELISNSERIKALSKNVADQETNVLNAKQSYTCAITDEIRNITYDFLQPLFYDWIAKKILEWANSKLPIEVLCKIDEKVFIQKVINHFGEDEFG